MLSLLWTEKCWILFHRNPLYVLLRYQFSHCVQFAGINVVPSASTSGPRHSNY